MHSLTRVSFSVVLLGRFVLSISNPSDDLESNALLFDSTDPSLFLTDDETNDFLTTPITDAALLNPCAAAQDDLSFTEGGPNLFSREDGPQCLPPVNIGADTLHLFENPLDSLENTILPFKGQNSDGQPPSIYPGRLPDGEDGSVNWGDMRDLGWKPYRGPVRIESPQSSDCLSLTAHLGNYPVEVCCDGTHAGEPEGPIDRSRMTQVDPLTISNQQFAMCYYCICMFLFFVLVEGKRVG